MLTIVCSCGETMYLEHIKFDVQYHDYTNYSPYCIMKFICLDCGQSQYLDASESIEKEKKSVEILEELAKSYNNRLKTQKILKKQMENKTPAEEEEDAPDCR